MEKELLQVSFAYIQIQDIFSSCREMWDGHCDGVWSTQKNPFKHMENPRSANQLIIRT